MKYFISITISLLCIIPLSAQNRGSQERQMFFSGRVIDFFTQKGVVATLTLMKSDSSVVSTTESKEKQSRLDRENYRFKVSYSPGSYIVRASKEGYHDCFANIEVKASKRGYIYMLPTMRMVLKKEDDIYKTVSLQGVEVKGTRVQIAWRGDTIVYDASAFNVAEGSTLSALVRQMPGTELKDNGDVYVNGQLIESLTLNGKSFFKGKNKILLDNLPYYTVKDVKVYYKSPSEDMQEQQNDRTSSKIYVMDVSLKKEYSQGGMANAEAGAGTHDRYMGRVFGLYKREENTASLFANLNNVNEDREPGNQGEWTPDKVNSGVLDTKMAGFHLSTMDKGKRMDNRLEGT